MQATDLLEIGLRRGFSKQDVSSALSNLDDFDAERLAWMVRWVDARHEFQVVPEGEWSNWVILAGRGSGKTRVGAEWSGMSAACAHPADADHKADRTLVVAPTKSDLRDVCFEGDSGLCNVIPASLIDYYHKSPAPQIRLKNGSIIGGIAAEAFQRTRGPQWNRAWCIIESSLVRMHDGTEKRIRDVTAGDYVMTRSGPRLVEWAGMTSECAEVLSVRTESGISICGTMEHPVWTQEEGFVCLSQLTPSHHVMCLPTAGVGVATQMATTSAEHVTEIAPTTSGTRSTCTDGCTSARSGRYLRGILSTTRTRIKAITSRATSSWSRALSTIGFIRLGVSARTKLAPPFALRSKSSGVPQSTGCLHAGTAARSSSQDSPAVTLSTAAPDVATAYDMQQIRDVRTLPGRHAVYNLKVRGQPEFFANGILVHNCDEVAAWGEGGKADPEEVWDTMVMSVRLGNDTRILVTTTPKNRPLVKRLVADPDTVMTTASTHVNQDNLSKEFSRRILKYDGTKIGRQEVYAELIDSEEGGIISRSWLKHWPVDKPLPEFHFIVMSIDSAFSEEDRDKKKQTTDPTAVSVWGCFKTAVKPYVGVMLLDCWAEYLSYPDLVDRIKRESDPELIRYGSNLSQKPIIPPGNIPRAYRKQMAPKVGGRPIDVIVIEGKANGKSLRQSLAKDGINTVQFNPTKDKLERGHFVSPIAKDGIIWVPGKEDKDGKRRFLSWAEPLVEQLCSYSGEGSLVHEDLYDTATQAWSTIDWYWLHHLNAKGKKDSKERAGTISEDHQPDRVVRNNPYAS